MEKGLTWNSAFTDDFVVDLRSYFSGVNLPFYTVERSYFSEFILKYRDEKCKELH